MKKKSFLWGHIRHLNPLKTHPQRITKVDKKWSTIFVLKGLNVMFLNKILARLDKKVIFALMNFVMKMVCDIMLCIK